MTSGVRFNEASAIAERLAIQIAGDSQRAVLVRDVLGRFSLIVDDETQVIDADRIAEWTEAFRRELGVYAGRAPVEVASSMFLPGLFQAPRLRPLISAPDSNVQFLNNTVVGEDWDVVEDVPLRTERSSTRVALYGFKGGVGRSTATIMLADALARESRNGLCVLVIDLDLESPGASALIAFDDLPNDGVVDAMVENAIENDVELELVARTQIAVDNGNGEVWLAPARGSGTGRGESQYVEKLNRIYGSLPGTDFAGRIEQVIAQCEDAVERDGGRRPDVVLLDSRAGIHDIAAAVISRIADLTFLFAGSNAQTWTGYRDLFEHWQAVGEAADIRERLQVVAAMVPTADREAANDYLHRLRERAYEAFAELYDDAAPGDSDAYAPAETDTDAPHSPIPIIFTHELLGFAPNDPTWVTNPLVAASFDRFRTEAVQLIEHLRSKA